MRSYSLTGRWQLQQIGEEPTYPAQVPGGVHTDLMAAGVIPDPFFADNELKVQWVAQKDWKFARSFDVPADLLQNDRVDLVCDGLDTLGKVSINGSPVGTFRNMNIQYRWDVKSLLHPGENQIEFIFDSTVNYVTQRQNERPLRGGGPAIPGGSYVRKAPSQFGWDWGPMLPPIGIWKDIRLEAYQQARIEDVHLRQELKDGKGVVKATVCLDQWGGAPAQLVMKITAPDGKTFEQKVAVTNQTGILTVEVTQPDLWWPNGYGQQPLYDVEITLTAGAEALDAKKYQIGFRTLELRRQPDQWGESFTFVVNGVPIFAKGADWIPADSFPTRITDANLEHLIRSAVDAHMNMLRVWGGGFYEEERFYDLCDRYGVLVWQDGLFACGIYPEDEDFFANVREEVTVNVRRLRHRASLALWCGNNEMEQGWCDWGWNKPGDPDNQQLKNAYDRMFHHVMPDIVAAEDPDRPYWPSSASSGIPFSEPNAQQRGDCHYWDVWHGRQPFTAYRSQYPRFMSEFGFQSLPTFETVKAYAEPKDWNMTSYVMELHQRSYKGNGLMISQMTDTFRMPKDFPKLVYLSMVLQAEGIRYGVEHWRRHKERVSGILYWQLNDCWPVASWASLDYYGRWKALHYMARQFYAPVLVSIEDHEENAQMDVWVTSDVVDAWSGSIEWKLISLDGTVIEAGKEPVSLASQESKQIFSRQFTLSPAQKRSTVFVAELKQGDQLVAKKVALFAPNKHLELVDPQVAMAFEQSGDQAVVTLTSQSLARFVELTLDGADVVFSDNYFDIVAGEPVKISFPLPAGWTLDQAKQAFKVSSLYQSF